jgi:glycosyltransferase involved in cell wall biosynthesis
MQNQITIDLRMYKKSGIGRYLQIVMPALVPRLNAQGIRILGNPEDFANETWSRDSRIEVREFRAPTFGAAEQWAGLCGFYDNSGLLWSPQYNVPLWHQGKLLVTIHDVCQLAHPETLGNDIQRWYARKLLSHVASRAEAILCVSEFTASEVQRFLEIDGSRLIVTYPDIANAWSVHSLPPNRKGDPYLLAVGNIKKHKNLRILIEAFERITERVPHKLIVVGKQDGFRNFDSEMASHSTLLNGRVVFIGHVSDEELGSYYAGAEALVFPSIYEGFGFPIIEAMVHGCPVACSKSSSFPEVAGDAALFFDPFSVRDIADAIVAIATDEDLRRKLRERGRSRAEQFRSNRCAEKTAGVINHILGSGE